MDLKQGVREAKVTCKKTAFATDTMHKDILFNICYFRELHGYDGPLQYLTEGNPDSMTTVQVQFNTRKSIIVARSAIFIYLSPLAIDHRSWIIDHRSYRTACQLISCIYYIADEGINCAPCICTLLQKNI